MLSEETQRRLPRLGLIIIKTILASVVAFILSLFVYSIVKAEANYSSLSVTDRVAVYDSAQAIYTCYRVGAAIETDYTKISSGQLFWNPGVGNTGANGLFRSPSHNTVGTCGDYGSLFTNLSGKFGFTALELVCAMGYTQEGGGTCNSNKRNFEGWGGIKNLGDDHNKTRANLFKNTIESLTGIDLDDIDNEVTYNWYYSLLKGSTCIGNNISIETYKSNGENTRYAIASKTGVNVSGVSNLDSTYKYELYGANENRDSQDWITKAAASAATKTFGIDGIPFLQDMVSGMVNAIGISPTCGDLNDAINDSFEDVFRDAIKSTCKAKGYTNRGLILFGIGGNQFSGYDIVDVLNGNEWSKASTLSACILGANSSDATTCATTYSYKDDKSLVDNFSDDLGSKNRLGGSLIDFLSLINGLFGGGSLPLNDRSKDYISNNDSTLKPKLESRLALELAACKSGADLDPNEGIDDFDESQVGVDGVETAPTCGIGGIGWVVCPVIEFLANVTDYAYNFIADTFLVVQPSIVTGAQGAWSTMRNIANIAFVIVFLIIIFSQLTSFGLANYGIKKMLPKLIIAAILVNISFFICQIAVDISNIAGKSVYDVFGLVAVDSHNITDDQGEINALGGWVAILTGTAGILAAGVGLALSISVPVLLAALLAVLMIVLILLVRIALIVLLTVISPLAFVAYLLPNTEHLFKKWLKTYGSLLMVYPIIGAVFGAGTLAASILANTDDDVMKIVAMGVAVVPFFIVPGLLKGSLNAVGSIGTKLSNLSSKANSRIGSKAMSSSRLGEAQRAMSQRMAQNRASRRANSKFHKTIDSSRIGRMIGGDRGAAAAVAATVKAEAESVSAAEQQLRTQSGQNPKAAGKALEKALSQGDSVGAKAAQNVLFSQGGRGVDAFRNIMKSHGGTAKTAKVEAALRNNINTNHGQFVKQKAADISSWAGTSKGEKLSDFTSSGDTWGSMSQADLAGQTAGSIREAVDAGKLNPETALGLIDNEQLSGNLDLNQKEQLMRAVDDYTKPRP